MTREHFEELIEQAFNSLPTIFKTRIENVRIVVEDVPDKNDYRSVRAQQKNLLGLYQGIPLTKRDTSYGMYPVTPDKITLYQKNIEAMCKTDEEVQHQLALTLFHELGHYFGMKETEIRKAMQDFV
ncbi:MAG: metallopeptidase family protein [bacterium]